MNPLITTSDSLITPETLQPLLQPYITTLHNSKSNLLTPAQVNGLVLIIVEVLMDNYTNKDGMRLLASVFNADAYEDLCNERVLNHYCGYPMCSVYDSKKILMNNHKTDLKFLQSYYKNSFCSKLHYQSNEFFKKQLTEELIFLRTDLFQMDTKLIFLDELLSEINDDSNKDKSMLSIIERMKQLNIDQTQQNDKVSELAGLVQDFEIVENTNVEPASSEIFIDDGYGMRSNTVNIDNLDDDRVVRGKSIEGYITK